MSEKLVPIKEIQQLLNTDLSGWHIEAWHELRLPVDERSSEQIGFFQDESLARTWGAGRGWYGSQAIVTKIFVLTQNGLNGYTLSGFSIELSPTDRFVEEVVESAKSKLTAEELHLINLT